MMHLKVQRLGEGLHPSEMVVTVATKDGPEELVVDPHSLQGDSLEIGYPVGRDGELLLVELPRQTARGAWRVWVQQGELTSERVREPA